LRGGAEPIVDATAFAQRSANKPPHHHLEFDRAAGKGRISSRAGGYPGKSDKDR
jgi:hypothetical protein